MTDTGRWLGIDLGTSSIKCVIADAQGHVLSRKSSPIAVNRMPNGGATHDPAGYRSALLSIVPQLVDSQEISGIGLCGHTPSLVAVDSNLDPISDVMLWMDQRANREGAELEDAFGESEPLIGTHLPWVSANLPAKLLWLARHRSDILKAALWLLQPKDLVAGWLTGQVSTDPWSSKGLCHVGTGEPSTWLFEYAGVAPTKLPPVQPAWNELGRTKGEFSRSLGIPPSIPVSVGWSDALAAMLGAGALSDETAFILSGSSDIVGVSVNGFARDSAPLFHVPERCSPLDLVYGPTQTSGAARKWAIDLVGDRPIRMDRDSIPTFVPYLAGERAPLWDPNVRGAWLDLDLATNRSDLVTSVLIGVACSDRHVLESATQATRSDPEQVSLVDPAPDDTWAKVRATVLNRPVVRVREPMASAFGAVMLGAAMEAGLNWVMEHLLPDTEIIYPEANGDALFAKYIEAVEVTQSWNQ